MLIFDVNLHCTGSLRRANISQPMYACICRGITEARVREAGRAGITAPDALIAGLGLDNERCRGRCAAHVGEFVELVWEGGATASVWHPLATRMRRGSLLPEVRQAAPQALQRGRMRLVRAQERRRLPAVEPADRYHDP